MNMNPRQRVIPALRITNYDLAKRFYVDGLGFSIVWEHRFAPHFPAFIGISRDGMELFLTQHEGDCKKGALVHLYVDSVDQWHGELISRGVPIHEPPNEDIPDLRNMTVVDPDGNRIVIVTRLS